MDFRAQKGNKENSYEVFAIDQVRHYGGLYTIVVAKKMEVMRLNEAMYLTILENTYNKD